MSGNNSERGVPRLFRHRCAVCGRSCETPFPPRKGLAVHCTACHKGLEAGISARELVQARRRAEQGATPAGQTYMGRKGELFDAVCEACGQPCRVPFEPDGKRRVLCRTCFRAGRKDGRGDS